MTPPTPQPEYLTHDERMADYNGWQRGFSDANKIHESFWDKKKWERVPKPIMVIHWATLICFTPFLLSASEARGWAYGLTFMGFGLTYGLGLVYGLPWLGRKWDARQARKRQIDTLIESSR